MAPPGKHMMSVFVQYAPPKIDGREWTDEDKDGFEKSVLDQISNYSPNFRDLILHCETRTPREIEAEVGLTEGNIFMGELTFDQLLFNRPFPGYSQYRAPIKGMYMCSSGTHPGGGVNGSAWGQRGPGRFSQISSGQTRCPEDMQMTDYDAVIIGAGHNGLICGAYLAKAGKQVLVVDGRDQPGGCASTRELAAGFHISDCAQWLYQFDDDIVRDLGTTGCGPDRGSCQAHRGPAIGW